MTKAAVASLDEALERVKNREEPYINGSDSLGVVRIADPESAEGEIRTKVTNLRDDPVGQMFKRRQLGDGRDAEVRLKAARLWQTDYERAEIGGAHGIDPTKEFVDCSTFQTLDTDARLRAQKKLNEVRRELGMIGDRLVTWVLGHKYSLLNVSLMLGRGNRMERVVIGARFRECLDTIAIAYYVSVGPQGARGPRRPRDSFDTIAPYADNPELHRAVRRARS